MSVEDYRKAYKSAKRDYQNRLLRGQRPTLEVLDDILPSNEALSVESLGLVQIPLSQLVGTRYEGRSNAFAGNFMPLLDERSEFGRKWATLSTAHETEGIHDPIKAWEYMNKFYVEEGNKRVSVMKFFKADSIAGNVTRILPKRTEEKENKIYYEFLDFYRHTRINYIWFSKEGCFAQIPELFGKQPDEMWTDDDRINFSSMYTRFRVAFKANGGEKLSITTGDAFLAFIKLYDYHIFDDKTSSELKEIVGDSWEEFKMVQADTEVELKMEPTEEKKSLLNRILPSGTPKLKIAFIYERTAESSAWTYSHELGRLHLEQAFSDEVSTLYYDNVTVENIGETLEQAVAQDCNIIFTTTPAFASASVKAAIAHPHVKILNCSLNTSHRYIRTYYARMHEAKFLMGAIAGAMSENDRLFYLADYPMFGTIANINAFALGAKMINPRAKVYLEWSTKKGVDINERIRSVNPSCVSGKDMVIPQEESRFFGIYYMADGRPRNLAMPLCHWGRFYERLIRTIMDGTWKYDDNTEKAINYWWGMSSGVVDVICSKNLPMGTKRLVELLNRTISTGEFNPFAGILYSQTGIVKDHPDNVLSPEEIMSMDWLAENVVGTIPKLEELTDYAQPALSQQGIKTAKGTAKA